MTNTRASAVIFALGLVLLIPTVPSTSSVPEFVPEPPSPEEVAAWDELVSWVRGGEFQLSGQDSLSQAIRSRPYSFELFRGFLGSEERLALLETIPYGEAIGRAAEAHDVDCLLVAAVVGVESGFRPRAVSPKGALGLMQLMPETAQIYGVVDASQPEPNLQAGAGYLRALLDRFGGDLELALAAYNAGPGAVKRFGGVPPYRETTLYVEKVLSSYVSYHRLLWRSSPLADLWLQSQWGPSFPPSRPRPSVPL